MAKHKAEAHHTHRFLNGYANLQSFRNPRERLNSDGDSFLQPPSEHLEHVARLLDDARQMPLFMRC